MKEESLLKQIKRLEFIFDNRCNICKKFTVLNTEILIDKNSLVEEMCYIKVCHYCLDLITDEGIEDIGEFYKKLHKLRENKLIDEIKQVKENKE